MHNLIHRISNKVQVDFGPALRQNEPGDVNNKLLNLEYPPGDCIK